ncbi:MAG: hypothetical protein PHE43_02545 [Candidatus Nanoarchaeia archaeon]|nr:hypothetical protein [Candidatus Nanoarchaeia archaeon]
MKNKKVTHEDDDFEGDNIYSEDDREELVEEDELEDFEDGFMQGYNEGERAAKCALCKLVLGRGHIEEEINGKVYRFCSEEHAEIFRGKLLEDEIDEEE